MTEPNGSRPFVEFAKKVGVVCGAMIAAGTLIQWAGTFLWAQATAPMLDRFDAIDRRIQAESQARQLADSLTLDQIANISRIITSSPGSRIRAEAMKDVIDAPDVLQAKRRRNRR